MPKNRKKSSKAKRIDVGETYSRPDGIVVDRNEIRRLALESLQHDTYPGDVAKMQRARDRLLKNARACDAAATELEQLGALDLLPKKFDLVEFRRVLSALTSKKNAGRPKKPPNALKIAAKSMAPSRSEKARNEEQWLLDLWNKFDQDARKMEHPKTTQRQFCTFTAEWLWREIKGHYPTRRDLGTDEFKKSVNRLENVLSRAKKFARK